MRITSRPNSPATASLAERGWRLFEKASLESAQAPTAPAASAGMSSTGMLRRRSGTSANQITAPITAATSAPRDCVSRMTRAQAPTAG